MTPTLWIAVAVALAAVAVICWLLWGRPLTAARAEAATWQAENARHVATISAAAVAERGYEVELENLRGVSDRLGKVDAERARLAEELAGLKAQADERDRQHLNQLALLNEKFAAVATQALDGAQAKFAAAAEEALLRHREAAGAGLEIGRASCRERVSFLV